jgi:hypothetical protein
VRSQLSTSKGSDESVKTSGELPENLSMKNPSLDVGVASAQPHDAHRSPLASSSGHYEWPVVSPG